MKKKTYPPCVWRSDGERYSKEKNGDLYTMDSSKMAEPYRYTFERLMQERTFSLPPPLWMRNKKD